MPRSALEDFRRAMEDGGCLHVLDLPNIDRDEVLVIYARNEEYYASVSAICIIAVQSSIHFFNTILSVSPSAQKAIAGSALVLSAGLGALGLWLILMYHRSDGAFFTPLTLALPAKRVYPVSIMAFQAYIHLTIRRQLREMLLRALVFLEDSPGASLRSQMRSTQS